MSLGAVAAQAEEGRHRRQLVGPEVDAARRAALLGDEAIDHERGRPGRRRSGPRGCRSTSGIGSPSASTIRAPSSSTAARVRTPTHSGSTIGSTTLLRRALGVDLRAQRREHLARAGRAARSGFLCHRHILPGRARLSSARDERRSAPRSRAPSTCPSPRPRRDDAVRPGDRARPRGRCTTSPTRSSRSRSCRSPSGCTSSTTASSANATATRCCRSRSSSASASTRWCRRSSARSPTAAPAGCRSCCSSRRCASARRSSSRTCHRSSGLVLFIVANFAYQAALIYYDATLKTVSYPDTRGRLSGIGTAIGYVGTVFAGLVILLLKVPVADRFRVSAILFLVFAIPIFLFVRERRVPGARRLSRRPTSAIRSASSAARSPTRARSRGSAGS